MPPRTARVSDSSPADMQGLGISREASGLPKEWGWGAVRWIWVFKYQDWMNLLLTIGFVIGLLIANSAQSLNIRPFLTYDATISYPYLGDSTVPYWVAIVVPLVLMIASFAVGELALAKRWHGFSMTSAVASLLHFTIDGISAFIITGFATQVTKVGVGRLRPDFLARCQPTPLPTNVEIIIGPSASQNPTCKPVVGEGEFKDGHYSFPSGHTSTVFSFAVYSSVYCIYALYYRLKQQQTMQAANATASYKKRTWVGRWLKDTLYLLGFIWILIQMGFAWGVGASRVTDNKHHVGDVVAGAFLGSAVALLYVLRAIPRHMRLDELDDGDAAQAPTPLLPEGGRGIMQRGSSDAV